MLQEVAAVDGVIEVLPFAVALLPGERIDAVDPTLGTDAVGSLDGDEADQIDVDAELGQSHGGGKSGQSTTDHEDSGLCHDARAP